jgi:hypothetical protein
LGSGVKDLIPTVVDEVEEVLDSRPESQPLTDSIPAKTPTSAGSDTAK